MPDADNRGALEENQSNRVCLGDLPSHIAHAPTYLAVLLDIAQAAEAHLHTADGLALGASEEARNEEVAAAAALANALYRLDGVIASANPQKCPEEGQ